MTAIAVLLGVVTILLVPAAITSARFFNALRARHEAKWIELGRPILIDSDLDRIRRVRRFFRNREYEQLQDADLTERVRLMNRIRLALAAAFWGAFLLILVTAAQA